MISKRRVKREEDSPDRWLVSYADFITLLFAFFVILFATSEQNVDKTKQFEESVKKFLIKFGSFGGSGSDLDHGTRYNAPIDQPIKTFQKEKPEEEVQKVETYLEAQLTEEELSRVVSDVSDDGTGVRLSLSAGELFVDGSAKLRPASLVVLKKIGALLKTSKKRIFVEGHADRSKGLSGAYPTSWDLAAARATAVVRYLIKVHEIPEEFLASISYGNSRAQGPQGQPGGAQKNHRLDFLLLTGDAPF